MRRLVFIDDDKTELDAFHGIVRGKYDYTTIHWPHESAKLFDRAAPDIFVSDLYLPSSSGDTVPTKAQRDEAAAEAKQVAERCSRLYSDASLDDKARLQETMKATAHRGAMMLWARESESWSRSGSYSRRSRWSMVLTAAWTIDQARNVVPT